MKTFFTALVAVFLCLNFPATESFAEELDVTVISFQTPSYSPSSQPNHPRLIGPVQGLDRTLVKRLNRMSRHFGRNVHLTPHGGCRAHGSRSAPRSQHRRAVGCKAADVHMDGVSRTAILRYWRDNGGGGRGYYCNRNFVHVDIARSRTWAWNCGRRRGRYQI